MSKCLWFTVGSFLATNMDAFGVLLVYFSRCKFDQSITNRDVILGEFVGFTIIFCISYLGKAVSEMFPTPYVRLLGILPLLVALKMWYYDWDTNQEQIPTQENMQNQEDQPFQQQGIEDGNQIPVVQAEQRVFGVAAAVFEVIFVTVGNGGDNIASYIPLFTTCGTSTCFFVFYPMVVLLLLATYSLVDHREFAHFIQRYGSIVVPIFLVAISFYILSGSILFVSSS